MARPVVPGMPDRGEFHRWCSLRGPARRSRTSGRSARWAQVGARAGECEHGRMTPPASSSSSASTSQPPSQPSSGATTGRRVSERVGGIAESATLAVDAKAKALKAEGRPVIGFGAGGPDFPTPGYTADAAVEACRDPRNHRYTPAGGLPELKKAIVDKTLRDSGYAVEPAQVLVTNGGKQAIYEAFATILDPGDE